MACKLRFSKPQDPQLPAALLPLLSQLWLPFLVARDASSREPTAHPSTSQPSHPSQVGMVLFVLKVSITSSTGPSKTQVPALTGLRFVTAFWIFAEHSSMQPLTGGGTFLVLSGCILSMSRIRAGTDAIDFLVSSPRTAGRFLLMRAARIYPLYFVVLSLRDVWNAVPKPVTAYSLLLEPLHVIRHCISTFASLAVESPREVMFLYVLYPLLEYCLLRPAISGPRLLLVGAVCCLAKLLIVGWATCILAKGGFEVGDFWYRHDLVFFGRVPWYSFAPFRVPDFALGMLVPHVAKYFSPGSVAVKVADLLLMLYVILALVPKNTYVYLWTDLDLQCPLMAFVMWSLCFGHCESVLGQLLANKWLVEFGTVAYGIYVFQEPLMTVMGVYYPGDAAGLPGTCRLSNTCFPWFQYTWRGSSSLCLTFLLLLVMAICGFHLVEEPARKAAYSLCLSREFCLRWLQASDVVRSFVQMITYAWPIPLSISLVKIWGLGPLASGFFLSFDQIGNVMGMALGQSLRGVSWELKRTCIVLCPLSAAGFSLVLSYVVLVSSSDAFAGACLLRLVIGLLQGLALASSVVTRQLTPADEQVSLSMWVNLAWTGGVAVGGGLAWAGSEVSGTPSAQAVASVGPAAVEASKCCAICSVLLLITACLLACSLPSAHQGPEQKEQAVEDEVVTRSNRWKNSSSVAMWGVLCIFIAAIEYSGVEVATSMLLETQFAWPVDSISAGVDVVFALAAVGSLVLLPLRSSGLLSDRWMLYGMGLIALVASFAFFDFTRGPLALLTADVVIYTCVLCAVGIAEGLTFLRVTPSGLQATQDLVFNMYMADSLGKAAAPPIARWILGSRGRNMYALYQVTLLLLNGFATLTIV
ncbi:unnamed protein product [Symbiodinium sp. CCMP2592]|nr:unnamed protein product [Symbiodinium sp. CCMP2592]